MKYGVINCYHFHTVPSLPLITSNTIICVITKAGICCRNITLISACENFPGAKAWNQL